MSQPKCALRDNFRSLEEYTKIYQPKFYAQKAKAKEIITPEKYGQKLAKKIFQDVKVEFMF